MTPPVENSTVADCSISPRTMFQSDTTFYDGGPAVEPERADEFADTSENVGKLPDWGLPTLIEKLHNRIALYWHRAGVPLLDSPAALSSPENARPGHRSRGIIPWEAGHYLPVLVDAESSVGGSAGPTAQATTKIDDGESSLREQLLSTFNTLFDQARHEVFSDGVESDFRLSVGHVIRACGDVAVHALHTVIRNNQESVEVVEEALRRIGSVDDIQTHHSRIGVLLQELESTNPRLRDAASIGIAELDDPIAIENISRAIDKEPSEQLRRNLGSVLSQLQSMRCDTS